MTSKLSQTKESFKDSLVQGPVVAQLSYLKVVDGKQFGLYCGTPDTGELHDEKQIANVTINDARSLTPTPSLDTRGFTMVQEPSKCEDLEDDVHVKA